MNIYAFKDVSNTDSSSGGAFPAIISAVSKLYDCLPVVYGAAFDEEFNVKHIRASTEDEYIRLRGSKYVRSDLGNVFQSVLQDLKNGEVVIFSGTPCQVAALKKKVAISEVDEEKLILVDIVCHGTPKAVVWNDFKEWLTKQYHGKLTDFSFRYKKARWKSYPTMARFDNGKTVINSFKLRRYTELFYSDLTLNQGCYKCPYATVSRQSDITIGDFWGIRRVLPDFPFKEEVSQILVSSPKGMTIIEELQNVKDYYMEEANVDDSKKYQSTFTAPTHKPINADRFWSDYNTMDFQTILSKYASFNFKGFIKHCIKRGLGETGLLIAIKNALRR